MNSRSCPPLVFVFLSEKKIYPTRVGHFRVRENYNKMFTMRHTLITAQHNKNKEQFSFFTPSTILGWFLALYCQVCSSSKRETTTNKVFLHFALSMSYLLIAFILVSYTQQPGVYIVSFLNSKTFLVWIAIQQHNFCLTAYVVLIYYGKSILYDKNSHRTSPSSQPQNMYNQNKQTRQREFSIFFKWEDFFYIHIL